VSQTYILGAAMKNALFTFSYYYFYFFRNEVKAIYAAKSAIE
jgi:hypothetical protein